LAELVLAVGVDESAAGRRAGHPAETLSVGLHSIGFLADTTQQADDDFYPGYAHTFTEIGKERGWPPTTRAQFDAVRGPTGALLVGDAERLLKKYCMTMQSSAASQGSHSKWEFLPFRTRR
jgi:hypothetical protein